MIINLQALKKLSFNKWFQDHVDTERLTEFEIARVIAVHKDRYTITSGAMVVDTPGMRELENFSVETGLDETFAEIRALTGKCRFSDCSHISEKGYAV